MSKVEKAFAVKYHCGNCGNEWIEEYEKGDVITEIGVYLHSHKCTHNFGCKHCKGIDCPVCGYERISVKERVPHIGIELKIE